jgi:hypothetical protein
MFPLCVIKCLTHHALRLTRDGDDIERPAQTIAYVSDGPTRWIRTERGQARMLFVCGRADKTRPLSCVRNGVHDFAQ